MERMCLLCNDECKSYYDLTHLLTTRTTLDEKTHMLSHVLPAMASGSKLVKRTFNAMVPDPGIAPLGYGTIPRLGW